MSEQAPDRLIPLLRQAWQRADWIFGRLGDGALGAQPIPLRHPFVFYLGHLPAFAWNHLGRRGLGLPAFHEQFDGLFERGIDPVGPDAHAPPLVWPEQAAILAYRDRVRLTLADALGAGAPAGVARTGLMVLEHELMHHETLLYMLRELPHARKLAPEPDEVAAAIPAAPGRVGVPRGTAVLGAPRSRAGFGWDNEFPEHTLPLPAFAIDRLPVTQAEFLAFVEQGGYAERRLWSEAGWAWRERSGMRHPAGWLRRDDGWAVRGLFRDTPLRDALAWPACVSWAEAAAYAQWRGGRLPTEAELHRAAYGSPDGVRPWPWGDAAPEARHGNFGFFRWGPMPVGAHPAGASAWGVEDLVGNGWEWTATPFGPFPGFAPQPGYPGYSADFFDGDHYVLLGASWATDRRLVRRSFRNWFQPHYPHVFSKFRLVWPD
jgi:ergothioneine biosynthesis protein EgtB